MEQPYTIVGTKVSPEAYEILKNICAKKDCTLYELMQIVCDTLVRYTSDRHNLSPEMEKAIMMFEHEDQWSHAFNLCDYTADKEVAEATYFIGSKSASGVRAVHVKTPFFGDWSQDYNVQTILERTLCLLFPTRYKRMRAMAVDMGCSSILQLIDTLIDAHSKDGDLQTIRSSFEDASRTDYGTKAADHLYRRKPHRTVDSFNQQLQQTKIDFGGNEE